MINKKELDLYTVDTSGIILYMDDDEDMEWFTMDILREYVPEHFARFQFVRTGDRAFDILRNQNVVALISDDKHPGAGVQELFAAAKERRPHCRLALHTASTMAECLKKPIAPRLYLKKPSKRDAFLDLLKYACSGTLPSTQHWNRDGRMYYR